MALADGLADLAPTRSRIIPFCSAGRASQPASRWSFSLVALVDFLTERESDVRSRPGVQTRPAT
jgi:hypothetical protein